ncbi:MAG: hypothetical protein FWH24_03595 [Oscillospiraceae bacterium]|nr:hypothetical protein [Oscillospiraceae bacterium]
MQNTHSRYYFTRLSNEQKPIYGDILNSLYNQQKNVRIPAPFKIDAIIKTARGVLFDNPELFYVDAVEIPYSYNSSRAVISFNFLYSAAEIGRMTRSIQNKTQPLLQKISNYTDYDKEKEIHDFLARNVKYNETKSSDPVLHNISGALTDGSAVCSGYSSAFKYLCDLSGMSCIYVSGEAVDLNEVKETHAWNIIKINGSCYHVDVTWNSMLRLKNGDCYDYFNISDAYMKLDHMWDTQNYPQCGVMSGMIPYFTSGSDFKAHIAAQLKSKNKNFSMRVNKKFRNEEEIYSIIQDAIPLVSRIFVRGIALRYNKKQDIINICINP